MTSKGDSERAAEPVVPADDAVPRLPRGRGLRLSRPEMLRVAGLSMLLVFLLVTQRPCANAVSKFVTSFDDRGSAAAAMPRPGAVGLPGTSSAGSAASSGARGSQATAPSAVAPVTPGPGSDGPGADGYVHLRGLTDAELKAAVEREQARAAGRTPGP